jgi:hypothetical protein
MSEEKLSVAVTVFMHICIFIGVCFGLFGLGIGLLFLTVPQAFGLGFVAFACGVAGAMTYEAKRLVRSICRHMESYYKEQAK